MNLILGIALIFAFVVVAWIIGDELAADEAHRTMRPK